MADETAVPDAERASSYSEATAAAALEGLLFWSDFFARRSQDAGI